MKFLVILLTSFVSCSFGFASDHLARGPASVEASNQAMEQLCNNLASHKSQAQKKHNQFSTAYNDNCANKMQVTLILQGKNVTCAELSQKIDHSKERANMAEASFKKYCP